MGGYGVATGKATLCSCQSGLCNSHYHGKQRKRFRLMFESALWALFGVWEDDDEDDGWLHLLSEIFDKCYVLNRTRASVT